jgi:hypothetical protein
LAQLSTEVANFLFFRTRLCYDRGHLPEFFVKVPMKTLGIFIFFVLLIFSTTAQAQTVDELRTAIQSSSDAITKAGLYKRLGDLLVEQDNLEQAADAFSQALALGRNSFSPRERHQMAIYLSWADR